ncbi:MAG: endo-1,4-beta-xylanase [Acidimicrobiia bacterium]|nr:endo-1,4-beta-xylanase [Acidimicrobiia bacterium]
MSDARVHERAPAVRRVPLVMLVASAVIACSACGASAGRRATPPATPARACARPDPSDCSLRQLATDHGVMIGAAVQPEYLSGSPDYARIVGDEFNSITPESAFKWESTEPARGRFTWGAADAVAQFARAHHQQIRGHTLVWANSTSAKQFTILPDYVAAAPDAASMQGLIDEHITAVVTRYAKVTDRWDVVNEPLETTGSQLDTNVLTRILGEKWMVRAFRLTHRLDPTAKLFVNESLAEGPGPKHQALMALVQRLRAAGAPIDGVGLQAHFLGGAPDRPGLEVVLRDWQSVGLRTAITELDIPTPNHDPVAQATRYADVVRACLDVRTCNEVTLWGVTDAHTWLNDFLGPGTAPLLFDDSYQPKPAYRAVAATIAASHR